MVFGFINKYLDYYIKEKGVKFTQSHILSSKMEFIYKFSFIEKWW